MDTFTKLNAVHRLTHEDLDRTNIDLVAIVRKAMIHDLVTEAHNLHPKANDLVIAIHFEEVAVPPLYHHPLNTTLEMDKEIRVTSTVIDVGSLIMLYLAGNLPKDIRVTYVDVEHAQFGYRIIPRSEELSADKTTYNVLEEVTINKHVVSGQVIYAGYGPVTKTLVIGVLIEGKYLKNRLEGKYLKTDDQTG